MAIERIFTFDDAKDRVSFRLGHRTDVTDAMLATYVDQAQLLLATNIADIEDFDRISPPCGLVIGQVQYSMSNWLDQMDHFWAITKMHNDTNKLLMRRGEWDQWLSMATIPDGTPSMWIRTTQQLFIFQAPTEDTSVTFYYRAVPNIGVLTIQDDWFETLVQVACYYALADIGKGSAKNDVKATLPSAVQLALQEPLSPFKWEALHDVDLGVYPARY